VMQVLSRRTKNNPVLIGEPGVGKTAIVEGIAQRIVAGRRARVLKDKRLLALDLGALVAGREVPRRVRGAPQGRAQGDRGGRGLDHPLHRRAPHPRGRRRGRGRDGRGEHAQARARARRAALHRRDHARRVPQAHREGRGPRAPLPAGLRRRAEREDTIAILRGLKERYEVHHGIRIQDAAIVAAATLSHRYITDRFLPDKAIDLVDEAASRLKMEIESLPTEIDQVERRLVQLEIERRPSSGRQTIEPEAPRRVRGRARRAQGQARHDARAVAHREGDPDEHPRRQGRDRDEAIELERALRTRDYGSAVASSTARSPSSRRR
jgi:ATP-dependent Clp protease ATP-binding subunit ClpB